MVKGKEKICRNYLPDLGAIPAEVLEKAKLLYLQYPNSPTGTIATKAFFKRVVKFAKTNHIAVIHDVGQFKAVQRAGITALYKPEITEITKITKAKYSRRLEQLVQVFRELGFAVEKPKASYYLYMSAPKSTKDGTKFKNAHDFAEYFMKKTGIAVMPYDDNGAYICVSAAFQALEQEEYGVYEEIRRRTQGLELLFK